MMQYKGYSANVLFDDENDLFHGEILGIRDVVTFQGKSVAEIRKAFKESVDDYLEFCRQRGESPEKPVSGRFMLRISPQLHRELCKAAGQSGQSLNSWIASQLEKEVGGFLPRTSTHQRRKHPRKKAKSSQSALSR
jgi:predicted HicB family RNase H-like nuclease